MHHADMLDESEEQLFPAHFSEHCRRLRVVLERHGIDNLLVSAGELVYPPGDDIPYRFSVSPYFRTLLPGIERPGAVLLVGQREAPVLFVPDVRDFWHAVPAGLYDSYVDHVDVRGCENVETEVDRTLSEGSYVALGAPITVTGCKDRSAEVAQQVACFLDHHRACKTPYEAALMRRANRRSAKAHRVAESAFRSGATEYEIRLAYLEALGDRELDQPYGAIVALNHHGAVLHYEACERESSGPNLSFLIDAGASCRGFHADITRSYAAGPGLYADLCSALDREQQALIDELRPGMDYPDFHMAMHVRTAAVLAELGVLRCSVEAAVESGITGAFFPHGLGHLIGAQVHDVGGFSANEDGDVLTGDPRHPFLRLQRRIEPGQVFTIEPGIYVIDQLLEPFAGSGDVDWAKVDELRPYGGVRIEDDVYVRPDGSVENFTRDAFSRLP